MSRIDIAAAKLMAALDTLESALAPLTAARAQGVKDAAQNAELIGERESLIARIAELEDETRSLAGVTEDVEDRLDTAIAEIRTALGR
jgi:hypothetical protein